MLLPILCLYRYGRDSADDPGMIVRVQLTPAFAGATRLSRRGNSR